MAALPQCIQSAKDLYDLRSRYKDASVLITAIYSESMVIAASLSQVQNLLQHNALQSKPQLLETFDRALTGCRVVYGCLEEEVRDLVAKADNNELRFKDKARFLWKEDTFKELLTQIRGQQSALSLLIQGLQMESISDIRQLVEDNTVALDQMVKRSRTLRQTHPRVRVPDSIFSRQSQTEDAADADSITKSAEFAFDDEVINSKAYRRAMALYTVNAKKAETIHERRPTEAGVEAAEDDSTALGTAHSDSDNKIHLDNVAKIPRVDHDIRELDPVEQEVIDQACEEEVKDEHEDLFDSLERDILSFMPKITDPVPHFTYPRTHTADTPSGPLAPAPLRSFSEGHQVPAADSEDAPPLPPRRPSDISATPYKARSSSSDDSIITSEAPSIFSKVSSVSSNTTFEASRSASNLARKPPRKPLPLSHKATHNVLGIARRASPESGSPVASPSLHNAEMHEIWASLLNAERQFVDRMMKLRTMFYNNIIREWPVLEKHLEAIIIGEQLADVNRAYLLQAVQGVLADAEDTICDPSIFETWTKKAHKLYREYCQRMPHAVSSLRTTQNLDSKFTPFVNTLGLSIAYFGMGWLDYLKLPTVQLQSYVDKLQDLINIAQGLEEPAATHECARLKRALEAVRWLSTLTSGLLEGAQNREDIQNLEKRIHTLAADQLSQLQLLEPNRRVIHQGGMAMKFKSQGPWISVHVTLLDNYLLWGKVKAQKKSMGDKIMVIDSVSHIKLIRFCR